MGVFSIHIEVGALSSSHSFDVDALVDTGATHTVLSSARLKNIGVEPIDTLRFSLADESKVSYELGQARIKIDGKERIVLVVFGPDDAMPLLGATTLENFNVAVDPIGKQLIPVDGLLKSINDESKFWLGVSQSPLDKIWNNPEDDVYSELLEIDATEK